MFGYASAGSGPVERLLCVAPLTPGQGVETVFAAFGMLADDRPALHLDVVGEGPLLETLRARARMLSLEDRIHFRGAELAEAEFGFSVLVLPRPADSSPGPADGPPLMLDVISGRWPVTGIGNRWTAVLDAAPSLLVSPDDAVGLAVAVVAVLDGPARAAPAHRVRRSGTRSARRPPEGLSRWHGARRWVVG